MTPPTVLQIDLDAIVANWRLIGASHKSGVIAAVVKADAYGLGASAIATRLATSGCRHFFVAHPGEGEVVRAAAPRAMVAVLNGLWPGWEPLFIDRQLTPVLSSVDDIQRWINAGQSVGRRLPALIHIDTGMNRLGLDAAGVEWLSSNIARLAAIDVRYVMTHLVSAERPYDPVNAMQRARFADYLSHLPPWPRSIANSSGVFLGPDFSSDLARPGAALFGVNPTPMTANPMWPVVHLTSPVLQLRDLELDETVGYSGIWRAARASRIATVCVGYADGLLRALSNRHVAYFDGRAVPLVGRVSMDLATYDVTDCPAIQVGDRLELIGPNALVDGVASQAGTNGYEILTALGSRYHRVYVGA